MQKKGIKIELALIDEVKRIMDTSNSYTEKLKADENTILKFKSQLDGINENINQVTGFWYTASKTIAQFEIAIRELGVDPKSNKTFMQAHSSVYGNLKLADKLKENIKGIK